MHLSVVNFITRYNVKHLEFAEVFITDRNCRICRLNTAIRIRAIVGKSPGRQAYNICETCYHFFADELLSVNEVSNE